MTPQRFGKWQGLLVQLFVVTIFGGVVVGVVNLFLEHRTGWFQDHDTPAATGLSQATAPSVTSTPTATLPIPTPTMTLTPILTLTLTPIPTLTLTPTPSLTLASPSSPFRVTIENNLLYVAEIYINGQPQGKLPAETSEEFLFTAIPATVRFELVRPTYGNGYPWGEEVTGEYYQVKDGDTVMIEYHTDDAFYFYPRISNNTDSTCEISINDGHPSEKRPGAIYPGMQGVAMGYYTLYSNSNVTLYCEDNTYWWGVRGNKGNTPLPQFVQSPSGLLELALNP